MKPCAAQPEPDPPPGVTVCLGDRPSLMMYAVQAFDVYEVGVAVARKLATDVGVSVDYAVADCERWNWTAQSYDGVVAVFSQFAQGLEHR